MAKENRILAVDIGGSSLKMAEFVFPDGGGIIMTNFRFRKIEKLGGESECECFERNYTEMLAEGGFTANSVRLLLSAGNSFQRLSKLPPILGSAATVSRLIEFEASQAVPYSMDDVEWDYQLLHHTWQENVNEEDEEGHTETYTVEKEEYEALFVAMKSEDVVNFTDVIERSGKRLLSVELASLALFNAAVVSQIREDESVLLLDIGAKSSCLMISDQRRIFMRNIPIGGDTVNGQIAREFSVSDSEAEDFKRRYGFVALGGAFDEPESELAATISKIARNTMTRLHGEISRSISVWRAQHGGNAPVRVLLAGGGSTMQYTTDFFQEKLRLPVEYLNTFGLISIAQNVDRNALQSVASIVQPLIGTALRDIGTLPVDILLLPRLIKSQYELNARKPYFYASAAALVSCLLISVVGISKVSDFEQKRVEKVEKEVKKAQKDVNSVKSVNSRLMDVQGEYNTVMQFLNDRNKFVKVLEVIQNSMPAEMWLVSLEPKFPDEESGEEMDMRNRTKASSEKTPLAVNRLTGLKELKLKGYALKLDKERDLNLANLFVARVKNDKSELFESAQIVKFTPAPKSNLDYFEAVLTLREEVKK